jgi:hypothetical protein
MVQVVGWIRGVDTRGVAPGGEVEPGVVVHGCWQGRLMMTTGPGAVPPLEAWLVAFGRAGRVAAALDGCVPALS